MFVSNEGPILHADLDAFYAAVEQRDDPALRRRPVIVGAGVVLAASYEAKAHGVRTAMPGRQARALCPHAIVVPPRMSAYSEASRAVFRVFEQTTPLVQGLSIDEAFLDVGGLARISGTPTQIAAQLRGEVAAQVGLAVTVGVARTKFLAKVASGVAKPDGLLVVPHDGEREFLHPLPVERLWGVGAVTADRLHGHGVRTVAQVAGMAESELIVLLGGAAGRHLHALALGRDPRPVHPGRRRRSMGAQRALGRAPRSQAELDATVIALADRLARRLRAADRTARTVTLRLRFADFSRASRSHTISPPTTHTETVLAAARALLRAAQPLIDSRGITLLGLTLSNLDNADSVQLVLPFDEPETGTLERTVDRLRDRFGTSSITRAALLGRNDGPTVPLLPD